MKASRGCVCTYTQFQMHIKNQSISLFHSHHLYQSSPNNKPAFQSITNQAYTTANSGPSTSTALPTTLKTTQSLALLKPLTYASESLTCGNPPTGLSTPKNPHSGPHPSSTSNTNNRSLGTTLLTNSACSTNVLRIFSVPKSFLPQPLSMTCLYSHHGLTKSESRWRRICHEGQAMVGKMVAFIEASHLWTGRVVRMKWPVG